MTDIMIIIITLYAIGALFGLGLGIGVLFVEKNNFSVGYAVTIIFLSVVFWPYFFGFILLLYLTDKSEDSTDSVRITREIANSLNDISNSIHEIKRKI